jgi:hypothetical protein
MRMKELIFTVVAACSIGLGQVLAATPAETAKIAVDAATASASQAATWAAEGLQKVQALEKGIADLEAVIKQLEAGGDAALLAKSQDELKKLKSVKARADKYLAKINEASASAAAAAAAAQDAYARATAEGVSEADALAAAGQAQRQAKKAGKDSRMAGKFSGFLTQWIQDGGFGGLTNVDNQVNNPTTVSTTTTTMSTPTTISTTTTTIPRPGPTPTQIGRGRRGNL